MNLTLAVARPGIAKLLKLCADDPRVDEYINRGIRRLLKMGRWEGTYARYNVAIWGGLLTLPIELRTCLAASRPEGAVRVRNEWFDFIGAGMGAHQKGARSAFNLHDMGDGFATVADIENGPATLRIYTDAVETASSSITLMGYDDNNNPVRTQPNGIWQDGETITFAPVGGSSFFTSAFQWRSVVQAVKTRTNGNVRLYYVDAHGNQALLGIYGPNTKNPKFRRYELPGFGALGFRHHDVLYTICKRRFIPAVEDNDILIIQDEDALEDMVNAIVSLENDDLTSAGAYEQHAEQVLNDDLREHLGDVGGVMDVQIKEFAPSTVRAFL